MISSGCVRCARTAKDRSSEPQRDVGSNLSDANRKPHLKDRANAVQGQHPPDEGRQLVRKEVTCLETLIAQRCRWGRACTQTLLALGGRQRVAGSVPRCVACHARKCAGRCKGGSVKAPLFSGNVSTSASAESHRLTYVGCDMKAVQLGHTGGAQAASSERGERTLRPRATIGGSHRRVRSAGSKKPPLQCWQGRAEERRKSNSPLEHGSLTSFGRACGKYIVYEQREDEEQHDNSTCATSAACARVLGSRPKGEKGSKCQSTTRQDCGQQSCSMARCNTWQLGQA